MSTAGIADAGLEKGEKEDYTPSQTILNGLKTYYPILAAGLIAFEIVRRYYPMAYSTRALVDRLYCDEAHRFKSTTLLKWVFPLYTMSDDRLLETCGMDSLFFVRFLRLGQKVALSCIILSGAMFPVYYTSGVHQGRDDPLYRMTFSNLSSDDTWRFWVPVICVYIMSALTCFWFWREFKTYIYRRHEYLSQKSTKQYSVLINGLPAHLSTPRTLQNYMELLYPNNVLQCYVARDCRHLEELVAEREKVRNKLEHTIAKSALNGEEVQGSTGFCGTGDKFDAVERYENELNDLNDEVESEISTLLLNEAKLAELVANASDNEEQDVPVIGGHPGVRAQRSLMHNNGELDPTTREYINGLRKEQKGIEGMDAMRSAGFVTFNSLKAAQTTQQTLQSVDPKAVRPEAAPHPEEIIWKNIGLSYNAKSSMQSISLFLSTVIIVFWIVPTAFIVSLSKVQTLRDKYEWINDAANDYPWVESVLEMLSPLLLSVMSALAPIIFGILSKKEGHASESLVESSLLYKLVTYQVFIVLLLPVIGGTVLDSITTGDPNKLTDINYLVQQISEALPVQSSFFITYILVQTGIPMSVDLLRLVPIAKSLVYRFFAPKLTPRERSSPWLGLHSLEYPGPFDPAKSVAQYFLILMLIFCFCPVAPILPYFAGLYLFLSELVYRWAVVCVDRPVFYSEARYFPSLYRSCILALIFSQVLIAFLLGTKKAPASGVVAIILPFITYGFHSTMETKYPHVAENLPLAECVLLDSRRNQQLKDLEEELRENNYDQPAMYQRAPIKPDYHALGSDPDDTHQLSSPPKRHENSREKA